MKIVVLAGGLSPERNVSRSTGAKAYKALAAELLKEDQEHGA